MAQLFSSGFETGNLSEWSGFFGTAPTVQSSVKRQGTYATEKTNASTGWFWKTLSNQTVFIRFYLRLTGYPSVESSFYVGEVATSFADVGKLRIGTDGKIRLYNGASGSDVLIGSPSAALSLNTWHRIELKEVCDNTNGELVARLNDVEFAAATALDTKPDANNMGDHNFGVMTAGSGMTLYFDDAVFYDIVAFQNAPAGLGTEGYTNDPLT